MPNEIIGLDIGTHSVKVVRLAGGREPHIVGVDEELLPLPVDPEPPRDDSPPDSDAPAAFGPRDEEFSEDADTQVRRRDELKGAPGAEESASAPEQSAADTSWTEALERLRERGSFAEDALTVVFLPGGEAMSIHQEVPFDDPDKVANILPHMLDDRLPVDASQVHYDFELIGGTRDDGHEAVVGFARRDHLGEFIADLRAYGLDPAVIGVPELLLRYVLDRCVDEAQHPTRAVIDIGHTFTRVLVLHHGEPVLARQVRFGGRDLTQQLAERLQVTAAQAEHIKTHQAALLGPQDAPSEQARALHSILTDALRPLTRDLRRTFQALYARSNVKLDTLYMIGGTAELRGLQAHLSQEFGVPVQALPMSGLPGFEQLPLATGAEARIAMAASLALQQIDDPRGEHLVNLRRGDFAYRGKRSFLREQVLKYTAAAAALFVVLLGVLYTQKLQLEAQRDAMRAALNQQTIELFGEPVMDNDDLKDRLGGEVASDTEFIPGMSAYQLLFEITDRVSADLELTLDRLEVDVERDLIQVYGETTSAQAVDQLEDDIDRLDCIDKITRDELRVRDEDEVEFELNITSGCS